MSLLLLETLRLADLDSYFSGLDAFGVRSIEALTQLTMQDYGVIGVQTMDDRKSTYLCYCRIVILYLMMKDSN
jgi:hypothetical protein